VKPTYEVKVWQEDDWWLARVVGASEGADPSPLNALTQARALPKIESMARDLVATILDAKESSFDVTLDYVLTDDVNNLLCQARGARAWLDAAQELWQDRSAMAAKALANQGYSLRETATLLGLSHQRVDQLLGGTERESSNIWAFQVKSSASVGSLRRQTRARPLDDVDFLFVVRNLPESKEQCRGLIRETDPNAHAQTWRLLMNLADHLLQSEPSDQQGHEHREGKVEALQALRADARDTKDAARTGGSRPRSRIRQRVCMASLRGD
jgi:hypothetical protein